MRKLYKQADRAELRTAVRRGEPIPSAARRLGVTMSTAYRWARRPGKDVPAPTFIELITAGGPRASVLLRAGGAEIEVKEFAPLFLEISRTVNKQSWAQSKELILRLHIVPRLGTLRLDEVSYQEIEDFKIHLMTSPRKSGKKLKAKTVNLIMRVLHRMLSIVKKRGVLVALPEVEWLRTPPPEFDFLSFEEAPRLIDAARGEWQALVTLALRTGLRLGELRALRWQDVDLQAGKMLVRQNLVCGVMGTPKSGKAREVPLSAATVAVLKGPPPPTRAVAVL